MASSYLNHFNNEQHKLCNNSFDSRISFSNDFVDTHQPSSSPLCNYKEEPVSSDFEFSFNGNAMIPADEIFSKGMLLPLKDDKVRKTTIREELLVGDCEFDGSMLPRFEKSCGWWKERLGLKRNHVVVSKRNDVTEMNLCDEKKLQGFKTQIRVAEILECGANNN